MAREREFKPKGSAATVRIGPVSDPATNWSCIDTRGYRSHTTHIEVQRTVTTGRGGNSFDLRRAVFSFDFTGRGDAGRKTPRETRNVRRVVGASMTINVANIAGGGGNFYLAALGNTRETIRESTGFTNNILGADDRTAPRALNSEQISRPVAISSTGDATWEFSPLMLQKLQFQLRTKEFFGVILLDELDVTGAKSRATIAVNRGLRLHDFSTESTAPSLDIKYILDNNRVNQGGGLARTTTSGFMTDNVFSGTNSGFSN